VRLDRSSKIDEYFLGDSFGTFALIRILTVGANRRPLNLPANLRNFCPSCPYDRSIFVPTDYRGDRNARLDSRNSRGRVEKARQGLPADHAVDLEILYLH